jgi:hypothetical protein
MIALAFVVLRTFIQENVEGLLPVGCLASNLKPQFSSPDKRRLSLNEDLG